MVIFLHKAPVPLIFGIFGADDKTDTSVVEVGIPPHQLLGLYQSLVTPNHVQELTTVMATDEVLAKQGELLIVHTKL